MDFDMLGLAPSLLERLAEAGLDEPTPIQAKAIPHAMEGRDVMGLAQTGTGKTIAFGLPLLDALINTGGKPAPKTVRSLILAPTRELVNQIADSLRPLAGGAKIGIATVVGGMSINRQIGRLERGADILVATPGRLLDLLNQKALTLSEAKFLVLDEADQMLDMGFIHDLRKIANHIPKERQTLLFSATMSKQMNEIAQTFLQNPVRVEVAPPGKPADKVDQEVRFVPKEGKTEHLAELLAAHPDAQALIFSRTKHGADRLMRQLEKAGFPGAALHGNRSQGQRDRALKSFRDGQIRVLIATDVAARGIDIPEVEFVYNYELPNISETYIHRIGRTGRAGRSGKAVSFCAPDELAYLRDIEKLLGKTIPVALEASWSNAAPVAAPKPSQNRRRGPKPGSKPQGQSQGKPRNRGPRRAKAARG
ncbi:ATP-dependent RNA helicase RhlE [Palleronia marisminoris]|uniref:DEAD-box ATP-dependent RNA helicase RhpA n=1 Tax=Palleronia marisminoris TaxID=315423 RepID=A0A1Y5S7N2_9RHOB|nr:DEAD/DEAH box helicase [Palleronia marisminoris]SFG67296.1 ATP-dependent RNA helicase RhlE [Palleronia marisminoris]SLN34319.1 ATP-dependent RNA helicase RhlE [Palleronia marisminoris]